MYTVGFHQCAYVQLYSGNRRRVHSNAQRGSSELQSFSVLYSYDKRRPLIHGLVRLSVTPAARQMYDLSTAVGQLCTKVIAVICYSHDSCFSF